MIVTEVVSMNLMTLNLKQIWIRTPQRTTIHRFHRLRDPDSDGDDHVAADNSGSITAFIIFSFDRAAGS